MRRLQALLFVAVLAWLVPPPAQACGCGVALLADVTRERALVIDRGGREEIIASFDLRPEGAGRAAIVLPVPADPEVEEIASGDPLTYLDIATRPPLRATDEDGAVAGGGPGGGVDVIGRDVIGGYDVARLRAGDAGALDEWLDENGYTLPAGAEPIMSDYIDDDWRFVAIRLPDFAAGALKPLRVSFAAEELVYPMKLTSLATTPVDLTLYVMADEKRGVAGLDVAWDGKVADLEPAPPPELEEVFAGSTHLTKFTGDGPFTEDLVISALNAGGGDAPGWGVPLAIVLAFAGLAGLIASRRG